MKKVLTAVAIGAATFLSTAGTALADTSSFGSFGNNTFGGSIGRNGFTASLGGTTTTVDGINTLNGSFSVTNPRIGSTSGAAQYTSGGFTQQYSSTTRLGTLSGHSGVGYGGTSYSVTHLPNGTTVTCTLSRGCS